MENNFPIDSSADSQESVAQQTILDPLNTLPSQKPDLEKKIKLLKWMVYTLSGILLLGLVAGLYLYQQKNNYVTVLRDSNVIFDPTPSPVPAPITTDGWKTYNIGEEQFEYPAGWEVIPQYTFKGSTTNGDITLKCSGPILQNSQHPTTLIAIESINIKERTDGGFCWSVGTFNEGSKRIITTVTPPEQISVSTWNPDIGISPNGINGTKYLFQAYSFNNFSNTIPDKNWYEFALIYEKGKDPTAEQTFDQILSTFKYFKSNQTTDTAGWKTFQSISRGITVKYPANWTTSSDEFISEVPFTPGEQDQSKIYNIIEIQKYPTQFFTTYTNSEWFSKITSLSINESFSDQRNSITKLTSGTVSSGENYVIFKNGQSSSFVGTSVNQVKALILKEETLYQFTLDLYDTNGLERFKEIIPTAAIQ